MATLLINNDMQVKFADRGRLEDESGNAITGATVEITLYEADGTTEVTGVTWPITMAESGDDGEYFGVLPADAEVSVGNTYIMVISVETAGGTKGEWRDKNVRTEYRDF